MTDIIAGIFAFLLIAAAAIAFIGFFAALFAVVTLVAWNVGVVAAVSAFGGTVAKITLLQAFCINLALGVIRRFLRRPTQVTATS